MQDGQNEDAALGGQSACAALPRRVTSADWQCEVAADVAPLLQQVHEALSCLESANHKPDEDVNASSERHVGSSGDAAAPSSSPSTGTKLGELCDALRRRGLAAQLVLPAPSGGFRCGRRSTGGGGQCVTATGRVCYFCSRQPYAVVSYPPACEGAAVVVGGDTVDADGDVWMTTHGAFPPTEDAAAAEVVVEACLREIFRAAPSTPEYAAAVEALPEVWAGPRAALLELAGSMCDAMALNFRLQGLDIPPWRRRSSVLGRWAHHHQELLGCHAVPPPLPFPFTAAGPASGEQRHHHDCDPLQLHATCCRHSCAPPPQPLAEPISFGGLRPLAADHQGAAASGGRSGADGGVAAATPTLGALRGWSTGGEALSPVPSPPGYDSGCKRNEVAEMAVSIGEAISPVRGDLQPSHDVALGAQNAGKAAVVMAAAAPPQAAVTQGSACASSAHTPAVVIYGFNLPSPAVAV